MCRNECVGPWIGAPTQTRSLTDWSTSALRGLSQEALAHEAGLHRNQVSNLERARSNREPFISDPQLSTVYRLAVALNVPPAYLLPDINTLLPKQSPELTDGSRVEGNYASASVKTRTGRPTRIRSS